MSLNKYIALEIKHQQIKPKISCLKSSKWNNLRAKNGPAKIKRFFTQCLGLKLKNKNLIFSIINLLL